MCRRQLCPQRPYFPWVPSALISIVPPYSTVKWSLTRWTDVCLQPPCYLAYSIQMIQMNPKKNKLTFSLDAVFDIKKLRPATSVQNSLISPLLAKGLLCQLDSAGGPVIKDRSMLHLYFPSLLMACCVKLTQ